MALIKWEPFSELAALRRQMDRLMESFIGREPMSITEEKWVPATDVIENEDEILVKVEVPGIDEKEISVKLSGDNLIINGERKAEREEKDKHLHRVERWYGSFERVIPIPVSVDSEKIKADYKKGVLEVHLPKRPEVKPKEIPINVK